MPLKWDEIKTISEFFGYIFWYLNNSSTEKFGKFFENLQKEKFSS